MQMNERVTLKRDVEAILIPAGTPVAFPEGSEVRITQSLGGSYTVVCEGMMARISGKDADALGVERAPAPTLAGEEGPVDEKKIWDQMRTCYDPEIPVNIVDLGLIYDCHVSPAPDGTHQVEVKMTLTAPGCGMGAAIASDVEEKIRTVPGVTEVRVELVWDPPWNQGMMTEAAKLQLGLL
jgi:probable FeS assembly SUF system protein SufT